MRYASNLENSFEMDRKCYNAPKTMTINNYNILEGRVIIVAGQNIIITNTTITPMSYFHAYIRSSIKAVNRVTQTTVKKMNGVTKTDLMRVNGVNNY